MYIYLNSEAGSHELLPADDLVPLVLGLRDFTCPMYKQHGIMAPSTKRRTTIAIIDYD